MRKTMIGLSAGVVFGLLPAGLVRADEAKKLAPAEIPPRIMQTVKARLPGAQISSAEKETENGSTVYDLEMKDGGRKYEMDIKEDGTLVEIEKQVMDVPAAVTQSVKAKYPDAKIGDVMEVNSVMGTKETPKHYEVVVTVGGKEKELVVSLDAKSVKEETEQ